MRGGERRGTLNQTISMAADESEPVQFITVERGDDLVVGYAIPAGEAGEVLSLVLQRTPKFEFLLPPEDRGVSVSHEGFPEEDGELVRRIGVHGPSVEIVSTVRTYRLDLSRVDPAEVAATTDVLKRMHRHGGFELTIR